MFYEYSVNSWTFIDDFFNLRLHQSSRPPKRWCPQVTVEPLLMATKALEAPKISCFNQHTKITHINYGSMLSFTALQVNIKKLKVASWTNLWLHVWHPTRLTVSQDVVKWLHFYTKSGPIVVPFMSAFTQVALTSKFWVSASSLDTTPVCNRMLLQVCQSKVAWFNHCMLR